VDAIVSIGPVTPFAAKSVKTIPVVMAYSGDPVDAGIVASLARPGGNVTGMSFSAAILAGKRVELLKETVSKISRVAILANPGHAGEHLELKEAQTAARLKLAAPISYGTRSRRFQRGVSAYGQGTCRGGHCLSRRAHDGAPEGNCRVVG
jgi:putative tryptophan/tyrosine transport system substrate-binding protein